MRTQLSHRSPAFKSGGVIVRFAVRMVILLAFVAISGVGFVPGLAMLLWMSAILSAALGTFKREAPLGKALNHWDEAVAYIALCSLIEGFVRTSAS